ncbi:MAG: nuclear transport factor 2 family protein, partial [Planctomycetota bacterium]|nr:nuclear transport factor 2 family protein [Planctomycetota bacterium]
MRYGIQKKTALVVAAVLLAGVAQVRSDDSSAKAEIRRLEGILDRAVVEGDVATFDRLFAKDFTHGSQSGRFRTKPEWIKGKVQGKSSYISFDVADLQVRVVDDTAVVTGVSTPKWRESDGSIGTGQFRFLRVWAQRDGSWQVVAFQATEVPAAAPTTAQPTPEQALDIDDPLSTREFSIKDDRPYLGGEEIQVWGLRCGNALYSQGVTERHVRNLDNMVAHGINCIGVYIQGSNGGAPDPEAGRNG